MSARHRKTDHRPPRPWRRWIARYGWRAGALPLLAAITAAVLVQGAGSGGGPASAAGTGQAAAQRHSRSSPTPSAPSTSTPGLATAEHYADEDACVRNVADRAVLVSISEQHAWMCAKRRQVYSTPVTTGAVLRGEATPTGSWVVQGRQRDRDLVGPGYRDFVHYWVPFNGDFGFHDATWQTMTFGSPDYISEGSHGCVHLPTPAMKWLYAWVQVNHTVVTVGA